MKERCPYCSFDPTSLNDYCDRHRPDVAHYYKLLDAIHGVINDDRFVHLMKRHAWWVHGGHTYPVRTEAEKRAVRATYEGLAALVRRLGVEVGLPQIAGDGNLAPWVGPYSPTSPTHHLDKP